MSYQSNLSKPQNSSTPRQSKLPVLLKTPVTRTAATNSTFVVNKKPAKVNPPLVGKKITNAFPTSVIANTASLKNEPFRVKNTEGNSIPKNIKTAPYAALVTKSKASSQIPKAPDLSTSSASSKRKNVTPAMSRNNSTAGSWITSKQIRPATANTTAVSSIPRKIPASSAPKQALVAGETPRREVSAMSSSSYNMKMKFLSNLPQHKSNKIASNSMNDDDEVTTMVFSIGPPPKSAMNPLPPINKTRILSTSNSSHNNNPAVTPVRTKQRSSSRYSYTLNTAMNSPKGGINMTPGSSFQESELRNIRNRNSSEGISETRFPRCLVTESSDTDLEVVGVDKSFLQIKNATTTRYEKEGKNTHAMDEYDFKILPPVPTPLRNVSTTGIVHVETPTLKESSSFVQVLPTIPENIFPPQEDDLILLHEKNILEVANDQEDTIDGCDKMLLEGYKNTENLLLEKKQSEEDWEMILANDVMIRNASEQIVTEILHEECNDYAELLQKEIDTIDDILLASPPSRETNENVFSSLKLPENFIQFAHNVPGDHRKTLPVQTIPQEDFDQADILTESSRKKNITSNTSAEYATNENGQSYLRKKAFPGVGSGQNAKSDENDHIKNSNALKNLITGRTKAVERELTWTDPRMPVEKNSKGSLLLPKESNSTMSLRTSEAMPFAVSSVSLQVAKLLSQNQKNLRVTTVEDEKQNSNDKQTADDTGELKNPSNDEGQGEGYNSTPSVPSMEDFTKEENHNFPPRLPEKGKPTMSREKQKPMRKQKLSDFVDLVDPEDFAEKLHQSSTTEKKAQKLAAPTIKRSKLTKTDRGKTKTTKRVENTSCISCDTTSTVSTATSALSMSECFEFQSPCLTCRLENIKERVEEIKKCKTVYFNPEMVPRSSRQIDAQTKSSYLSRQAPATDTGSQPHFNHLVVDSSVSMHSLGTHLEGQLRIQNNSPRQICFRVTPMIQGRYQIIPCTGKLDPNQVVSLTVAAAVPQNYIKFEPDQLKIETIVAPSHVVTPAEQRLLWREVPTDLVQETLIGRVRTPPVPPRASKLNECNKGSNASNNNYSSSTSVHGDGVNSKGKRKNNSRSSTMAAFQSPRPRQGVADICICTIIVGILAAAIHRYTSSFSEI